MTPRQGQECHLLWNYSLLLKCRGEARDDCGPGCEALLLRYTAVFCRAKPIFRGPDAIVHSSTPPQLVLYIRETKSFHARRRCAFPGTRSCNEDPVLLAAQPLCAPPSIQEQAFALPNVTHTNLCLATDFGQYARRSEKLQRVA